MPAIAALIGARRPQKLALMMAYDDLAWTPRAVVMGLQGTLEVRDTPNDGTREAPEKLR